MTEIKIHPDGSITLPATDRETLIRALMWSGLTAQQMANEAAEQVGNLGDRPEIAERHQRNRDHAATLAAAITDLEWRITQAAARQQRRADHDNRP